MTVSVIPSSAKNSAKLFQCALREPQETCTTPLKSNEWKKNVRKLWSFKIKSYYTKTRASRCKLTPLLGTQSLHVTLSMQTEHGALRHNICLANIPTSPRISALLGLWRGSVNQEDLQRKFNIAYPRQSFIDKKIFFSLVLGFLYWSKIKWCVIFLIVQSVHFYFTLCACRSCKRYAHNGTAEIVYNSFHLLRMTTPTFY